MQHPSTSAPAHSSIPSHALRQQMAMQLVNEAIHGTGDSPEEREVALQNFVVGILNQNHQLWQAFRQVGDALGVARGDSDVWERQVTDGIDKLLTTNKLLARAAGLTGEPPLNELEKAELQAYLHQA